MTSRDFAYWLQGFLEIGKPKNLDEIQLGVIRAHLNMVFKHEIDPSMGDEKHQQELNDLHPPIKTKSDANPSETIYRC